MARPAEPGPQDDRVHEGIVAVASAGNFWQHGNGEIRGVTGVTKAVLLAQSGDGGSPFSGAMLLYVAVMLVACVVLFIVLHRETRARRKARGASAASPVEEDGQT